MVVMNYLFAGIAAVGFETISSERELAGEAVLAHNLAGSSSEKSIGRRLRCTIRVPGTTPASNPSGWFAKLVDIRGWSSTPL